MSPSPSLLHELLSRVRRRRRGLAWLALASVSVGILAGMALVSALFHGAGIGHPALPTGLGILSLAFFCLLAIRILVRPYQWTADLLHLARAMDDRVATSHDSLSTAIELERRGIPPDREAQALQEAALLQAEGVAQGVKLEAILPLSASGTPALMGPVLILLLGLAWVVAPEAVEGGWRTLWGAGANDPGAASSLQDQGDLPLSDVRLSLTPPAYTGWEPVVMEGSTGDLEAMPGTQVEFTARLPFRAAEGRYSLGGGGPFAAEITAGNRVTFQFVVPREPKAGESAAGEMGSQGLHEYRVEARPEGLMPTWRHSRKMTVRIVRDAFPTISIAGATGPLDLRPEEGVTQVIHVEDDFGISRVDRVVYRGGQALLRKTLGKDSVPPRRMDLTDGFTPGAEPALAEGGEFEIVVEAWDNDTVSGPKVTRSPPLRIHILTPVDRHRRLRDLQEELKEKLISALGEHLVQVEDGYRGEDQEGVRGIHARNREQMMDIFRLAGELREGSREDPLEAPLRKARLGSALDGIARAWDGVDALVERDLTATTGGFRRVRSWDSLLAAQGDLVTALEKGVLTLDEAVEQGVAEEVLARANKAEDAMANLMKALDEAKMGKDRKAELNRALQDLQRQLSEMAKAQQQGQDAPRDEYLNPDLENAQKFDMGEIQKLIAEGKYQEALEKMRKLAEALAQGKEQLQEQSGGMAGEAARQELARLDALAKEAREMEKKQEGVMAETDPLAKRFGEDSNAQALQEAARKLGELEKRLGRLPSSSAGMDAASQRSMAVRSERAQEAVQRARRAAQRGDGEEALAEAESSLETLMDLESMMGQKAQASGSAPSSAAAKRASQAAGEAAELNREILESLEGGESAREQRQQAAAEGQGTARKQRGLRQGVSGLQEKMQQGQGSSLFDGTQGGRQLEASGQLMESAAGDLEAGEPGRSRSAQKQALEQLREFRQGVEQARSDLAEAMKGSGKGSPGGQAGAGARYGGYFDGQWGRQEKGEVELPLPDEFLGPEEFRRAVMEGAAEDVPDAFRYLNSEYYQELVK